MLLVAALFAPGSTTAEGEPVIQGSTAWLKRVDADNPKAAGPDHAPRGAEANPTGDPIGGGTGYGRILRPAEATIVVRTADQLLSALKRAAPGTVIYVADDAVIDLTEYKQIAIPGGVTLAGGRGNNGVEGGLIFTRRTESASLFQTGGPGVRITGLRLEGPWPGRARFPQRPQGIVISHSNVEVDNCEMSAWSYQAISVQESAVEGTWIHHNYIHHNQDTGTGYGVSVSRTHALIEANLFDFCRHAIASSGRPGSGYTARYNVHLENTISHVFDMHGARDFEKYELVGLWRFDEGTGNRAEDNSIRRGKHDGALRNMDESSWGMGRIGKGLRFDGRDDYVDMGAQPELSPAKGLTAAAWIRPESVEGTRTVLSKGDIAETGGGYSLRIVDGVLEGALYDPEGRRRSLRAGRVTKGRWHYAAMTWDGVNATLYLDGRTEGIFTCEGRSDSDDRLLVGRDSKTATSCFHGAIDEVRLYNDAIKAEDVQRQFNGDADVAGRLIVIHHNTIRPVEHAALTVRGRPSAGCWAHHNRFFAPEGSRMVEQLNAVGNFHVFDNEYLGRNLVPAPDFTQAPLFGRWAFDPQTTPVVKDTSGRGRHGRIRAAKEPLQWEQTDGGHVLRLQAKQCWLEIPQGESEAIPERVAVGMRMRIDRLRESQVLLDNGLFRFYHRGGWTGNTLFFLCRIEENESAGQSSWRHYAGVRSVRPIQPGKWFEVVGEIDGKVMRIYLDGMLEFTMECLENVTPSTDARTALNVGQNVDGALSEVWLRGASAPVPEATAASLHVTGEQGYTRDGVEPDAGTASTLFRFRVLYKDADGREPAIGFPRLHILRDGKRYLDKGPVTMLAVDRSPCAQGRLYTYTMRLPKGTNYQYFFEVETMDGQRSKTKPLEGPEVR